MDRELITAITIETTINYDFSIIDWKYFSLGIMAGSNLKHYYSKFYLDYVNTLEYPEYDLKFSYFLPFFIKDSNQGRFILFINSYLKTQDDANQILFFPYSYWYNLNYLDCFHSNFTKFVIHILNLSDITFTLFRIIILPIRLNSMKKIYFENPGDFCYLFQ